MSYKTPPKPEYQIGTAQSFGAMKLTAMTPNPMFDTWELPDGQTFTHLKGEMPKLVRLKCKPKKAQAMPGLFSYYTKFD